MRRHLGMGLLFLCLFPASGAAQKKKETLLLFRDGFSFQGVIVEKGTIIIDPATGISFPIPAGGLSLNLDDGVRRIFFAPTQLHDAIKRTEREVNDRMAFVPAGFMGGTDSLFPGWVLAERGEWDSKWHRTVTYNTSRGPIEMKQRIVALTPFQLQIQGQKYRLDTGYLTKELSTDLVRGLVWNYMEEQKGYKGKSRLDKLLDLAKFFQEMGRYKEADKELQALEEASPEHKDRITPLRDAARSAQANLLVEELEKAHKIGQHDLARHLLIRYAKGGLGGHVSDRHKLLAQEIKDKYEVWKEKLEETRKALTLLPEDTMDRAFWKKACQEILAGLNEDTFPRVTSFLTYAQQYQRDVAEKGKASQSAEEVLSLALTGWLQGDTASEPSTATARKIWKVRDVILGYLQSTNPADRPKILGSLSKEDEVSNDQAARMIQLLPPARPPEKITTEVETREIGLLDSAGGSYLVQLPPEYHPHRSYPVLMLLHGGREKPEEMFKRCTEMAARDGYILAMPLWGKGTSYSYSVREHALVLDTLRDLRQVCNVDPDRVFLLGWETGGDMAFDVGMAHPDQFAGVIPMNGNPHTFPAKCWTNAQYLPFYVVEGELNGGNPKANRTLFKDWVGSHYPALYVEYKGRGSEWYQAELDTIFDWMGRKKRHHPMRNMGRNHTGGGKGEEFCTMRRGENRFYWLSAGSIAEGNLNDFAGWSNTKEPATLQANLELVNVLELKGKDEVKGAKVQTNIYVRTKGVKQVSLHITPAMHDFDRPLQVQWNGRALWPTARKIAPSLAVLLEDYATYGDRQRLIYAKVDMP